MEAGAAHSSNNPHGGCFDEASEIVSRADALSRGLTRFFTGEPCKRGHVCERNTASKQCLECSRTLASETRAGLTHEDRLDASRKAARRAAESRLRDPVGFLKRAADRSRKWRESFPGATAEACRRYRLNNPGRAAESSRAWAIKNPEAAKRITNRSVALWKKRHPDRANAHSRAWRERYPWKVAANSGRRRAYRLQATPAWADKAAIRAIYEEASRLTKETGVLHHVDHRVALKGADQATGEHVVCGLHVEQNLRAIPWMENIRKKNKFREEVDASAQG